MAIDLQVLNIES